MQRFLVVATLALTFVNVVNAECANACNGHGKCTSYDMCICNRNWQASDCSERVCQFGLAHVDTPKGDLDMSGDISDADTPVLENSFNYPYGTTEMFPAMQNSDLSTLPESAHYYMECSNKGTCDRGTGECNCFDGFDGASCQRASCPNSCSGHGVCKTIEALAKSDDANIYKLWDREATMGCECDAGYLGADCSQRECKHGIDPLYFDDSATVKYSTYNFVVAATDKRKASSSNANDASLNVTFHDGTLPNTANTGEWAIRFYDIHGEDWVTQPLKAGATCAQVVAALEALPNDVIPKDYTVCTRAKTNDAGDAGYNTPNELDFDGVLDNFEKVASAADEERPITFSASFWETVLPGTFADAMKKGVQADFSGDTFVGYPSSYGDAANDQVLTVGYYYRIKFYGNPGKLKEPEIEIYLDGKRPSLLTTEHYTLITRVYTDGQQGESDDYFADHCDGVTAYVNQGRLWGDSQTAISYNYLGLNEAETKLLKACLGSSDDDDTNNVETYNWDWGNAIFPHLVKLVRSTTTYTDGGYYVALVWENARTYRECDSSSDCFNTGTGGFRLINPFNSIDTNQDTVDNNATIIFGTDLYEIYTTKGTLALATSQTKDQTLASTGTHSSHHYGKTEAIFGMGSKEIIMTRPYANMVSGTGVADVLGTSYPVSASNGVNTGSVSCEHLTSSSNYYCLNKTDIFTVLSIDNGKIENSIAKYDTAQFNLNPPYINLYSAEKLVAQTADYELTDVFINESSVVSTTTGINRITTDISTNWASAMFGYGTIATVTASVTTTSAYYTITVPNGNDFSTVSFIPRVGDLVQGSGIPSGTFITDVTTAYVSGTTDGLYVLSQAATATATTTASFFRHPIFQIYKFIPAAASTYKYVAECSNRGTCDTASGLCTCFAGYSSDACQTQNSLAV